MLRSKPKINLIIFILKFYIFFLEYLFPLSVRLTRLLISYKVGKPLFNVYSVWPLKFDSFLQHRGMRQKDIIMKEGIPLFLGTSDIKYYDNMTNE